MDPMTGGKRWSERLGLACEGQFSRDYNYFKTQMAKLEGMKEPPHAPRVARPGSALGSRPANGYSGHARGAAAAFWRSVQLRIAYG